MDGHYSNKTFQPIAPSVRIIFVKVREAYNWEKLNEKEIGNTASCVAHN